MIKLLVLVAVAALFVVPAVVSAQATDLTKEQMYVPKKDDVVKKWTVSKTFEVEGVTKTMKFELSRVVTSEPDTAFFIYPKTEEGDHYKWTEGVTVAGDNKPIELGYYTVRASGKYYKAYEPVAKKVTKTESVPGKGWKRGMTVVR
jgi:hypothetical protein